MSFLSTDKGNRILVRKESSDLNDPLDETALVFELSRIVKGFHLESQRHPSVPIMGSTEPAASLSR